MKKVFKLTALLLSVAMVLSLAACGKSGSASQSGGEEKVKLTIGIPAKTNVVSFDDNAFTRFLEEKTGYDLEFVKFSSAVGEEKTQLTTMVAAKETLPDLLYGFSFTAQELNTYGSDGYFLDLTPYFEDEELTADYRARVAELYGEDHFDYVMSFIKSADGKIYGYPTIATSEADQPWNSVYINTVWLDKLGLEMPTNYEEFVEVLRAFKTGDPNGNGIADEIPAIGSTYMSKGNIPAWILNNWLYLNDRFFFNVEDGKLTLPHVTDEYREGVQALHDLVDEGLLSSMSWTIAEQSEYSALCTPANQTAICGVFAGHMLIYPSVDNPVALEYQPLPPFNHAPILGQAPSLNAFITADTKYPDECFNLMQVISTEAGSMACRYGEEGVDWEWSADYATGNTAVGVLNTSVVGGQNKSTWSTTAGILTKYGLSTKYHTAVTSAPEDMTWSECRTQLNNDHAAQYLAVGEKNNPDQVLDWALNYNDEELDRLGNIQAEITSYLGEMRAKFATGELDPYNDADWDRYVQTLNDIGLETWVACAQSAYDRFMAN